MTAVSLRHSPPGLNLNKLNKPEQPSPETEQPPKGALNYKGPKLFSEQGGEEVSEEQRQKRPADTKRPPSATVQLPNNKDPLPKRTANSHRNIKKQSARHAELSTIDTARSETVTNYITWRRVLAARVGRTSVNLLAS